mmetsp:Transcript_11845/g.28356  ORF Transcript_11845/g.28356 Transcript_11845/m.28356 type:complete len:85 (-) Transcript_11845:192-446(-)
MSSALVVTPTPVEQENYPFRVTVSTLDVEFQSAPKLFWAHIPISVPPLPRSFTFDDSMLSPLFTRDEIEQYYGVRRETSRPNLR